MEEKKIQGVITLIWLTISTVLEIIFLIAWMIWKTKIALFLLCAQSVLWFLIILLFVLWKHSLRKSL